MNDFVFDVPLGVVTDTCRTPVAAPALMLTVAVTCVELTFTMLLTVIPVAGLKFTDDVWDRFVPFTVSVNVSPRAFLVGEILPMVGAGDAEFIVNTSALDVPPPVVTVRSRPPTAAAAPMLIVQVTWPAVEFMLVKVTLSGGLKLIDVVPVRLPPLMESGNDAPGIAVAGDILLKLGAPPPPAASCVTVKACPAIVIVPLRAEPVFASTEYPTEPLPLPGVPLVIVIHAALLVAVHAQPVPAVTVTLLDPPPDWKFALVGVIK